MLEYVRRPLALLTIKKAVERLPVEVLPNGIVQVQQSTTVRDKLRAEKEARQSVANSLEKDAAAYLDILQDIVRELDAQSETGDYYIPGVTAVSYTHLLSIFATVKITLNITVRTYGWYRRKCTLILSY